MGFWKRKTTDHDRVGEQHREMNWERAEGGAFEIGEYRVVPCVKQLNNGHWVGRFQLETQQDGQARQHDYPGPMREYASAEEAVTAVSGFARDRLDEMSRRS